MNDLRTCSLGNHYWKNDRLRAIKLSRGLRDKDAPCCGGLRDKGAPCCRGLRDKDDPCCRGLRDKEAPLYLTPNRNHNHKDDQMLTLINYLFIHPNPLPME